RRLVDAAEAALEAAIALAGAGVSIRRLSTAIEQTLTGRGLRPMKNLCGHHVGRWIVHSPPPVPNTPDDAGDRLAAGATLAIEPFATQGLGFVGEVGRPEVFRVLPGPLDGVSPAVAAALGARNGLPFSRRDLRDCPRPEVEAALSTLYSR